MPPMLQVMKDIGGVEMPEYFARTDRRYSGRSQASRERTESEWRTGGRGSGTGRAATSRARIAG